MDPYNIETKPMRCFLIRRKSDSKYMHHDTEDYGTIWLETIEPNIYISLTGGCHSAYEAIPVEMVLKSLDCRCIEGIVFRDCPVHGDL